MTVFILSWLLTAAAGQQAPPKQSPSTQDEAAVFEQVKTSMRFEDDGTGRRDLSMRIKAQSEAAIQQLGQLVFGYNAATERLDILYVRVRKPDGTTIETPASAVQELTSPIERVAPVYTDFRQKHITVQSFRPGDTLEVSTRTTIHTALAPGQFWTEYSFNEAAIVLDEQLDIDVPAARKVILKTEPPFTPAIETSGDRRRYHWAHTHLEREKKPDDEKAKAEDDEPKPAPVRLTSFTDWPAVSAWFAGLERTARVPSPEVREKAKQLTEGRTADIDKVLALYDFVSKNFRYVSLSLGAGRYQPRNAADVLRDAYGDCKDKHTLLASLLDAAGIQASAVLMNSRAKVDPDFPSPSQFDHVITLARIGAEDVWLDATPEVAPFRLLGYTLRGKQGLVAASTNGALELTPADPPTPTLARTTVKGSLKDNGTLSADVDMAFRGDMEFLLRAAFRATPRAQWSEGAESIARESRVNGKVSNLNVSDPQATDKPFTIAFHIEAEGYANIAGQKLDLALPFAGAEATGDPSESKPIELGTPGATTYSLSLSLPAAARLRAPVPVSVTRDYADYKATYAFNASTLSVDRSFTLRQHELPQARRSDYLAFVRVLRADAAQPVSIDGAAIAAPALSGDARAKELHVSGYNALEAGEYDKAIDLLTRALAADPKLQGAPVNLARAYLAREQADRALSVLKKQAEANPYEQYVNYYMGSAYVALHQYDAAEQAYNKELELNPLDKWAPGALGAMYMERKQYDKAAAAYERSAAVNPEQSYAQVQMGKAYLNLKRLEDARNAFDRAVELSPTPGTWNNVAYQLALGAVDLDRAQRYAESAVSAQTAASRNVDVDHIDVRALAGVSSLANYWDTLGWVHFARKDLAKAEKYVLASWNLAQHAEVGDHLGQIYEKTGRSAEATAAYARALSASAPAGEIREHLARVAGGPTKVNDQIAAHRADLGKARTISVDAKGPVGKTADVFVVFSPPGMVEAVSFIKGDEAMKALLPAVQRLKVDGVFPDAAPAKVVRRGILTCAAGTSCALTLLLPQDAKPAK